MRELSVPNSAVQRFVESPMAQVREITRVTSRRPRGAGGRIGVARSMPMGECTWVST